MLTASISNDRYVTAVQSSCRGFTKEREKWHCLLYRHGATSVGMRAYNAYYNRTPKYYECVHIVKLATRNNVC